MAAHADMGSALGAGVGWLGKRKLSRQVGEEAVADSGVAVAMDGSRAQPPPAAILSGFEIAGPGGLLGIGRRFGGFDVLFSNRGTLGGSEKSALIRTPAASSATMAFCCFCIQQPWQNARSSWFIERIRSPQAWIPALTAVYMEAPRSRGPECAAKHRPSRKRLALHSSYPSAGCSASDSASGSSSAALASSASSWMRRDSMRSSTACS